MKLHLPVKLRSAVLACMTVLTTIGTTVVTATMAGGAFSLVVSSSASAAELTLDTDTTWQIGDDHSQDVTTVNGVTLTISGKAANNSTDYNFGDITVTNGGKLVLPTSPGASSASDSANAVGTDAKLQIASAITLEEGSTLDCNAISFYLKNPLTIVGSDTMNIRWSKSYDFEGLVGDADAQFNISLASHGWADYSLVRVLDENATYKGKIALTNASNATMSLLGGGERTFASAAIDLGSNTRLLLGNASVQVRNLTGSGSVELCPQDYVPTSEMTVPGAATLVVSAGSGTYTGSFGDNVSLNLTGGSLTLQGQTLDATRLSVAQGATLTLSGVTLDGTSLQGEGNYAFSGNITLTGDFGEIQDGTVLFAGSNVTAADGTVFTLSGTKVGWDTSAAYVAGKGVVVSNTVTQLAFATETITNVSYDILYTKSLGATISYNAETHEYTAQYVSGDGQTYSISGGAQTGNGLVVVGTDAVGAMPEQGMTLEVTSGTYQGLSFTRVNGSTVGTLGTAEEKAQLTLNITGDASVSNFIDGGQGLLGWTGNGAQAVFNSNISATVNTTGSTAWLNLTGESNYAGSLRVNGDLTANILSGTIGADTAGEKASLASGAKGAIVTGNATFNIGELGTTGPTILGSVVGGIVQRDGGATGSMTGDVVININSGSIAGNIYATGSKATLNGNYTVNYSGGTLGGQIAVSAGGAVTGTKTLNICGSAVLDTTKFEYAKFDKVTIAENACLNLVGDVTIGITEIENKGTVDFAGVTSLALDLTGLKGTDTVSEDGTTVTGEYIVLEGGTLTNTDNLGAGYSYENGKLVYSTTVNVHNWDANWGIAGLTGAPESATTVVADSLTGLELDSANFYGLGAASDATPTIYQNTQEGYNSIQLTEEAQTILGDSAVIVGGVANTSTDSNVYGAVTADSWIYATGGIWQGIVGGNLCNNWNGGTAATFNGDSHIDVKGGTIGFIIGGNLKDGGNADFNGSTYISVYDGASVTGSIIGGSATWHQRSADVTGSTNIWIYTPLTTSSEVSQMMSIKYDAAVVGGSARLNQTALSSSTLEIGGSTNVHIVLGDYDGEAATFTKRIIGGSYTAGGFTTTQYGTSNVSIEATSNITFNKQIVGGTFAYGDATVSHQDDVNLSINGGTYSETVAGGSFLNAGTVTATHTGDINLSLAGGSHSAVVSGGSYIKNGTAKVTHAGDINVDITSGTYTAIVSGGTYIAGGTSTVTHTGDVNVHITYGTFGEKILLGGYVANSQSSTIQGTSTLTVDGGTFTNLVIGGMYENTGSSIESADIVLNLNAGTYDGAIVGGHYTTGNDTAAITKSSTGDVTINIGSSAVVNNALYGGTVLQRTAGASNVLTQGNISVNLAKGATINGNIYAAGGDYVGQAATSVLTTESTRVAIDNGVTLRDGIVISGGYIGMSNSAGSVVAGDRTLALTGTGAYDFSKVTLQDFNTVEVTDAAAVINMGVTLQSAGVTRKTGAGTYQLMDSDEAGAFEVLEGTLKLSNAATMTSLTVSKGATLDATSGAVSTDLTLGEGSILKLGSSALNLGTDKTLTLGSDLTLDVTGVDASDSVELVSGLASVMLGTTSMEAGKWMSASDYFSSVVLGGTSISDALLKLEGDTLVVTDAKNAALYWEGASNDAWGDQKWAAAPGGTDLGSFLSGTQVFFESNTQQEVVLVNQDATAYDINVNGDYRFDDAGGSLAVSNALNVGSTGKAAFGVNVDLSEATVNVALGGELSLTGDTTVNDLENAGEVAVDGALTINSDTASAGSLEVSGDLTLTDSVNTFGTLDVAGDVNTNGEIRLTGAAGSESSIGSLSGASVSAAASHRLTLTTGASTLTSLSMAGGSSLTLASGVTLSVGSVAGGGQIDVTLDDGLNGTGTQLTLGGLVAGTTLNFKDATKQTLDTLFAGGASSVVLAQLSDGAVIEGSFLLDGSKTIGTDDGNIYKVVTGANSVYVYYAHSGLVWDASDASVTWGQASAWESSTASPGDADSVVFNGGGSSTVTLGTRALANNVYIESEVGDKVYTFTDGFLDAAGTIYVTSGSLTIGDTAEVTAAGVEVTTGSLTVAGSLDAGKMVGNQVTLDGSGVLTLGDESNVQKVLSAAGANGTLLAVSDGTATVGSASVGGVNVADGATLQATSLTLTGTNSLASGTVNAETLAVTVGGSTLGALNAGTLLFSDIGAAGAGNAILEVDSISSLSPETAVQVDFTGLNISEDGVYTLVHSNNALGADFTLTEEAVQYLSTLRFDAVIDSTSDANTVSLHLSTLDSMVWRTSSDTDSTGRYVVPLDGADMYKGLEPIKYVVVNGDKTLDYTEANPESATVPSLGAVVRNMSGLAGYTLTFVGNSADEDRVTFVNDADDVAEGAHTIAGENITLQVGATADEFAQMHETGILTDEDGSENHALTVGGVDLTSSALVVRDEEGVKFTTGVLNGDADSSVSGTVHINGAGGKYEGSGNDATIVLEQGADQLFTNASGIVLAGSAGTAQVDGGVLGGLATTGADVVLVAPGKDEAVESVQLEQSSSMQGGSLTATVDSAKVFAGEGDQTALFTGAAVALNGTQLVLNSDAGDGSMVADVDLSKTDGFVITNLHTDDASGSAEGATVTISGGVLNKYFGNATVQGNQVLASRNADYYSESLAPLSPNGNAGLTIADGALLHVNPQNDRTNYRDLAAVLDSLDAHVAAGDSLGADRLASQLAGAEAAGMGMAFSNDMDRQLRAIRNRTTTMGVNEAYVNPDMPYFNAWVNAEGDYQQVKRDAMAPGFTLSSWGGTLGADVDFNEHVTAGLAATAMYGDFSAESVGMAEGDLDTYYVTAFARYSPDSPWVHTFVASVGMADASLKRTVTHANGSYTAEGDTTGLGFGLLYEVGYTIALNEDATSCLQPVFNISYVHTELDGYRESGSDAALNFGNQKMDSFTLGLGARWQALVGENIYNRTSMFESRALLKFTSGDRSSSLHSSLANGVGNRVTVKSEEQGAIGVELGAGLSVPLGADAGTFFIDGSLEAYTSYTNVNATVGWRINF